MRPDQAPDDMASGQWQDEPVSTQPSAIVTGASRGLGLALARSLASSGWALAIDARSDEALEEAARLLKADGALGRRHRR